MPTMQVEQRIELTKIGTAKWRVVGYLGRAIFFYAEAGSETAEFSVNSQLAPGDIGTWRAVDTRRHLVVGHSGKASVAKKPEGAENEVTVNFMGVALAI